MSRSRRTTRDNVGMNLFPFLAVLICTMGSLIVLLVVMVQQARVRAAVEPPVSIENSSGTSPPEDDYASKLAEHQQQLKLAEQKRQEIEDFKWQTSLLQASYQKTVEQLSEQRLVLSHLESHTRELSEKASRLQAEADMIQQAAWKQADDSQQAERDVSDFENRIATARAELEDVRDRLSQRTTKYSLVPYDGPNGTNRRPIYIECLSDRVIMQPENVILRGADFREPLTNDNPLALALRAKREYLQQQGFLSNGDEPYPLLIVRPGSAASYAAARAAMTAWESEFGYELVEADIELDYAIADPRLVRLLEDVVEDAREKKALMLRAMRASRSLTGRRELLRPSAQGGFERVSGGSSFMGPRRGLAERGFGRADRGHGAGGDPIGGEWESSEIASLQRANRPSRYDEPGDFGGAGGGPRSSATSDNLQDSGFGSVSDGAANFRPGGQGNADSPTADGSGALTSDASNSSGQGSSGAGGPSSQRGANAASAMSGFSQNMSLAETRGRNWAVPDAPVDAVGITRPIRVRCDRDRLVLIPEKGSRQELQIFRHDGSIQAVIDPFVDAVRGRLQGWGIAGQGIFWKPIVQVDVRVDAEGNYEQLVQLLENSGIEVKRQP